MSSITTIIKKYRQTAIKEGYLPHDKKAASSQVCSMRPGLGQLRALPKDHFFEREIKQSALRILFEVTIPALEPTFSEIGEEATDRIVGQLIEYGKNVETEQTEADSQAHLTHLFTAIPESRAWIEKHRAIEPLIEIYSLFDLEGRGSRAQLYRRAQDIKGLPYAELDVLHELGIEIIETILERPQNFQFNNRGEIISFGGICTIGEFTMPPMGWWHNKSIVSDRTLVDLADLLSLEELYFRNFAISDAGLVHLRGLQELKELSLDGTRITDAGLQHLSGLVRLKALSLRNTRINGSGLEYLSGLPGMRSLDLCKTLVGDAGLEGVAKLTDLEELWLDDTPITDDGLSHLNSLSGLKLLSLRNCRRVSFLGVLEQMASLEHLSSLFLAGVAVPDPSLFALLLAIFGESPFEPFKQLRVLKLPSELGDKSLGCISNIVSLEELELINSKITDNGLGHFENLINLKRLDLAGSQAISGVGIYSFSKLNKLQDLDLQGTSFGDKGCELLRMLSDSLVSLSLSDTEITDNGLVHLQALKKLKILQIEENSITDAGLEHLAGLADLRELHILGCQEISEAGVARLKAALPKCDIIADVGDFLDD